MSEPNKQTPPPSTGFTPPKTNIPKGITIDVQPKEPPKEVLDRTFEMSPDVNTDPHTATTKVTLEDERTGQQKTVDTNKSTDDGSKTRDPNTGQFIKKEEPKSDDKKDDTKEDKKVPSFFKPPAGEKKETTPEEKVLPGQIKLPDKKETARDYTGFSAEEQQILKQMSNDAFAFTSKLLKEQKTHKEASNGQFYQHPDAYVLSPQFQEVRTQQVLARNEGDIWRQLLAECKSGKAIKPLIGWHPNTGDPMYGNEIQPTEEVEEKLRLAMNKAYSVSEQLEGQVKGFAQNYREKIQQDTVAINAERAKRFMWAQDPQYMKWTLPVQMGDKVVDRTVEQIKNDFKAIFPDYHRNSPATEVASDLMVALIIAQAELNEAKQGQQIAVTKQEELKRGEPSSQVKPAPEGSVIGKVREFSIEGMPH